ncbi:cobalt-precorrin-4 C(11)-methyltransferase [Thermogymnomonas acidicola]|uniref:Cobalt-precorrin-4 C(11)-methyltransferase n=1 Tax=Thermogymnomonas acidicola TaxID=399579 RepID=A0AA37BRS1_9ARCH|nr:precorrin-4 C(11)-methyltransferase [Thermogymnomonas acidicola]GGM74751.1 cobalt-precorrin-4 C(11)-methyltransferase [Thermogymnomonas acidicola]
MTGNKVYIVGAGPGDPELLTVKAHRLLVQADLVIYAGSLVNPEILRVCRPDAELVNSATMTMEEVMSMIERAYLEGRKVVRLHSGDPHIYGAIREQMDMLREKGIPYEVVPGVSVLTSAAASLGTELTLEGVSQSILITRGGQRIPLDPREDIRALAQHRSTMVIFAAIHMIERVVRDLVEGGYSPETPVGVVYHSTWPDELVIRGTLQDIVRKVKEARIYRTALIVVGDVVDPKNYRRSKLYDPGYTHSFRRGNSGASRAEESVPAQRDP